MITAGLRRAIDAAAGRQDADPLLRPGPAPGSYTSSLPFRLDPGDPAKAAARLAARLGDELWIASAEVTGPGFLTVTVTHATLARLAIRIANARPACAESDALGGPAGGGGGRAGGPPRPRPRPARRSQLAAGAGGPRRRADRPARRRRRCHH